MKLKHSLNLKNIPPGLILLGFLILVLFVLTRITPLLNHQVAYTYDQGRDFLKASELVDQKNLTFIGPTTGTMGLFHGAWWYYLLAVPYWLFQGLPIGFYYFNITIQLLAFSALFVFAFVEFGLLLSIFTALIIISAPYYTSTSLFVGNNIMAIPTFLILLITLYYLIKHQAKAKPWLFLVNGLSVGLVSEFELAFGIFLIPSYFLTIFLFKTLRKNFLKIGNLILFLAGLLITFSLRILFELKNNFSQIKTLLNLFIKPKLYNPKPLMEVVKDRWQLFGDYYQSLFINEAVWIFLSLLLFALIIRLIVKKREWLSLRIFSFLLLSLFTFSLFYKDNFWANYYEGIHSLMLLSILLLIFTEIKTRAISIILWGLNLALLLFVVIKLLTPEVPAQLSGLAAQEKVVAYLYDNAGSNFCVDVYTPPAIPYTYRYLFYYGNRFLKQPLPSEGWQNNRCWYILEYDDYKERKQAWIDSRIPQDAKLIKKQRVADIDIQLWQK